MENFRNKLGRIASKGLYRNNHYSTAKYEAQENLAGRTHYAEDPTLKYFKARILKAKALNEGLFFLIVESSAADYQGNKRGFRAVLFDVFGTVIYRRALDEMQNTRKTAEVDFWAWFNSFDEVAYYREVLQNLAKRKEGEAAAINNLLNEELAEKVTA